MSTSNNIISFGSNQLSMSSREIAELVESKHDHVKKSIRRLVERKVIEEPRRGSSAYINNLGHSVPIEEYIFSGEQGKRDSIIVVAQLSPEFTAKLVDRWQELEAQVKGNRNQHKIPQTYAEALRAYADEVEERERVEAEKDVLQIELDQSKEWLSIKKVADFNGVSWKALEWQKLKAVSEATGYAPKKVFDANFPKGVNAYHRTAWEIVYPNLILDPPAAVR